MTDRRRADPAAPRHFPLDPSPDSNTIRARRTNECGMLRERTIEPNCSRSATLNSSTTLGLPIGRHYIRFAPQVK